MSDCEVKMSEKEKNIHTKIKKMNTNSSCIYDDAGNIEPIGYADQELPEEEVFHEGEDFSNEDKILFLRIRKILSNDLAKATKVTKICLEWVEEQVDWGGKYDRLMEEAAGDDT